MLESKDQILGESSSTRKLARFGVSSVVSRFWNSVHARAVWCIPLARRLLILLGPALCCSLVQLRGSD
jgi:hypothetical protein